MVEKAKNILILIDIDTGVAITEINERERA